MSNSETYSETGATQGSSPYQSLLFDEEGGSSGSSHPCTNTPENPGQSPSEDNSPPAEPDELVQQIRETIHAKLATVTHEQWYIGVERVTLAEMADELERKLPVEGHPWTVNLLVDMLKGLGEQRLGLAPLHASPRTDLFPLPRRAAKLWTGIPLGYREEEPRPTKWTRYEHDAFWRLKNSDENVYHTERGFSNWIISRMEALSITRSWPPRAPGWCLKELFESSSVSSSS
ncbi:uncharacterized protein L3040_005766 [Drepanopeziza brunnea f. sp. 'multigermtubi']|uniref:uncharacterized protein n=1 Tax=Drepanopeziza brunnea f. sp. 'multigermtubi' TaxID=698441 RepID=UPI0023A1B5BC|nr:hypothetical protein L3040_005766 [Drepanopeziza brunnea f. sp. 'multigermtubi']